MKGTGAAAEAIGAVAAAWRGARRAVPAARAVVLARAARPRPGAAALPANGPCAVWRPEMSPEVHDRDNMVRMNWTNVY